ncbi:MAG: DUF177 domain-containing protein [Hyphomicrobiales bacterium]
MPEDPLLENSSDSSGEEVLLPRPIHTPGVPKKGQRTTISLSDGERQAICAFYDLQEIKYFEARTFLEKKTTTKFRLTGIMKADVVQTCVLSLKPVKKVIEEEIDLTLVPTGEFEKYMERTADGGLLELGLDTTVPDTYDHEIIQLGSFVLEYFALGLDPYPRAENAEIDQSAVKSDHKASAFSSLAALKDKMK